MSGESFSFGYSGAICEEGYVLTVPTNIKTLLAGNEVERARIETLERNGSPAPIFETNPERLSFC